MTESKDVTTREKTAVRGAEERERTIRPEVDIFEDDSGITVLADMPGVSRDQLDVQVDNETLSVAGSADIPVPKGMDAIYADIRATRYQRSFSLSRELDTEHVEANLKDGVLTLRIPKREEHKPRRIEVRTH